MAGFAVYAVLALLLLVQVFSVAADCPGGTACPAGCCPIPFAACCPDGIYCAVSMDKCP